jgi:hypothetical protein
MSCARNACPSGRASVPHNEDQPAFEASLLKRSRAKNRTRRMSYDDAVARQHAGRLHDLPLPAP